MKNRTLTISLLFVILTTVLSSCGNLLHTDIASPEKEQQSKNTATITGSFTSDIPGIGAAKPTQTRAAYPSSFDKSDYDLSVYAIDVMNDVKTEGAITGDTFKIAGLTIGNKYKIRIEFSYYDSWNERYYIILSGESDPVTISEERTLIPAISLSFPTLTKDTSQFIPLQGSIDVIFRYTGSTYANFWDYATNYIVSGIDNSLAGPDIDIIQGNDFKIYYTGLYSGIHHITIMFANQIFLIDEDLYVYPCMTTNTWVSSDTNNVEGNVFKITDEMIEQYQKNTFYVDSHQTENGNGTYWSPFNTIDTAFQYAVTNLSSNVRIFIKDGSELTASGDYQNLDFNYKNFTMEAYTDTPGDKKGTASITFTNETASIFHLQNTSTFNVTGINFFGGDSYSSDGEGGFFDIDSGSTATFTNCSFTNGKSGSSGGAIANNGTCTLNGCTFSNNQAETAGGAIFSTGTLTISGTTTIENNIADGNKYEFLSFYGNLTLDGTLNFKDSERFEFHKGNDSYAASSVTLVEDLSVTGSVISKIPLYYDSESNGGTSILNQCFFASGSGSKAAQYFTVPDDGYSTFDIDADGIITTDKLFVNSASSNTTENGLYATPYKTISAALTAANSLSSSEISIFIKDGTEEDCGWTSTISLTNDMSIKVYRETPDTADSNPGTATLYCMGLDDIIYVCADVSISGLIFDGRKASNFLNCCIDLEETHSLTLTDCSFINIKPAGNCGSLAIRSNATFKNCTFHNNDINITGQAFGVTKSGMVTFEGSISIADGEYISLFGNQNDASAFGKIHLESNFSAPDSPYTLTFSNISDGAQIITGKQFDDYNQLFTVPEGYSINSEGEYKKQVFPKTITAGERYTIEPTSNTTADDINNFLSKGNFEFTVDLDLSEMAPDEIKKINVSLPHVETLVLPEGTSFDDNQFGGDSENKGSKLKKVIINGDVTGSWMFQSCDTIEEVVFEEGVTEIPDGMFSKCTSLKTVSLPSTLKTIGYHAFANSAIVEITIPASVTTIKHFAFYNSAASTFPLNKVTFEDAEHVWSIRKYGTGAVLTTPSKAWDNLDINTPATNATWFKEAGGRSENYYWVKSLGLKAPSEVGDIVFTDGSAISYSESLTLSDEQKAAAIAVIYYVGTDLNNAPDTSTVRTLGVGLNQGNDLSWCTTDANAYSRKISSIESLLDKPETGLPYYTTACDHKNGSNNLQLMAAELGDYDDTNDENKYKAFYYGKNYGTNYCRGSVVETGWYLPSSAELTAMSLSLSGINASLRLCNGTIISNSYISSSQGSDVDRGFGLSFSDGGDWQSRVKDETYQCRAIREF